MLEFLRENLLCSSGDSPKRNLSSKSRRRPGEIISSQGTAGQPPLQPAACSLQLDNHRAKSRSTCSRQPRTPSPLQRRWGGSRSPASSFRETLGNSLAYTGAAASQQDDLPGRGLYVSMQRGLGPRGASRPMVPRARTAPSSARTPADPSVPSRLGLAASCEVRCSAVEDGQRACVFPPGGACESETGEPFTRFLHRAADTALARSIMCANSQALAPRAPVAPACWGSGGGSFLMNSDACSFLVGRDSGSFGSVWIADELNAAITEEGLKATRIAATPSPMQCTAVQSKQLPNWLLGSSTPSVSYRAEPHISTPMQQQAAPQQLNGNSTPTMPATRILPLHPALTGRSCEAKLGHRRLCGPSFVAVSG